MIRPLLVLFVILGFVLAMTACVSSRPYHRDYDYRDRFDSDDVREMAEDLEDATEDLKEEAEDELDRGSESEDFALDAFDDLNDEAEDFLSELEDEDDLEGTEEDFRSLMDSYHRAREAMRAVRGDDDMVEEFDRVSAILTAIGRAYGFSDYGYNR